jgi:hypothetical protein
MRPLSKSVSFRKARRSFNARRRKDPSLPRLVPGCGRTLPDGTIELSAVDGSVISYLVVPVLGWRVVAATPVSTRVVQAVRASIAEALAVAGLPPDTKVDCVSVASTVMQALGRQSADVTIKRMASTAAYLAVERILDANTTAIAAE